MASVSNAPRSFVRYWISDPLDGLWKSLLHHLMRLLPIAVGSAIGAALGRLIGPRVYPRWDARARRNFLRIEPDSSAQQLDRAMRASWSNLGRTYAEFSALDRLWTSGRMELSGIEHLLAAKRDRRPFVIATTHLANWELILVAFVHLGIDGCAVFQPSGTRFEMKVVSDARDRLVARHPVALYPPGVASARAIYETVVRRRQGLIIHVDESLKGRINAPSFGRPLEARGNIATAVRLALAADALLMPSYAERIGDESRLRLVIEAPLLLERSGDRDADIRLNVQRLDERIDSIIRPRLAQWMMLREPIFE